MKSCAVPLCENDTYNRPDLKYFPLPKKVNVRKEWLKVVGIKREYRSQEISICEIHFKDVDFRAGRKDLKVHTVPTLHIPEVITHDNDDDEEDIIPDEADCKPEIAEGMIKEEQNKATPPSAKRRRGADDLIIKQETDELFIKQEADEMNITQELETETGRRPSRRAALVAAKKISSTVRHCGVKDDVRSDPTLQPTTPKTPARKIKVENAKQSKVDVGLEMICEDEEFSTVTPKTPARKIKAENTKHSKVDVDFEMICEDEELSTVQRTFLKLAQEEYNLAIKNLKELAACNVKIIQEGDTARHLDLNASVNIFASNGSVSKAQNEVKASPKNTNMVSILAKNTTKSGIPIIYV